MIKINYACPKSWDAMNEVGDNVRHCKSCTKNVKDFSNGPVQSLEGYGCGRFQLNQIDRVKNTFSLSKASLYTTSLLAAMGAVATTNTAQAQSTEKNIQNQNKKKSEVHIRGLVKDKSNDQALPFVNVVARVKDKIITGATADYDGKFQLLIDTTQVDFQSIYLEFSFVGYQKDSLSVMEIKDELLDQDLVIDLETNLEVIEAPGVMMGIVVLGDVEETPKEEDRIEVEIEEPKEEDENQ